VIYDSGGTPRFFFAMRMRLGFGEDLKLKTLLFFCKWIGFGFYLDFEFKFWILSVGWDIDAVVIYNSGRTPRFFLIMRMRLGFGEDLKFKTLLFFCKWMGFGFYLDFKSKSWIFAVGWNLDSVDVYNSRRTPRFFLPCALDLDFSRF
jgi:hypothetical protein